MSPRAAEPDEPGIPCYDQLPELGQLGLRHGWGVWGEGDRLGTLNRLTDETCRRALHSVQTGRRLNLCLPLSEPDPPLYGRTAVGHRVFQRNRNMIEDEVTQLDPQGSSQWDSLRHIAAKEHGFYGGRQGWDSEDVVGLGIHTVVDHGFVARGVLIDMPRYWEARGEVVDAFSPRSIDAVEIRQVADHQGVTFEPGDLLLVRSGWLRRYRDGGVPEEDLAMPPAAGLAADEAMARFLWDTGFCAVAVDNPAVEVLPSDPAVGSLHRRLIPALGMPLGELWDLESLGDACAASARYELCVVSVPINMVGGVASPANAMAVL